MAQTCFKSLNQDARMLKPWVGALIWTINLCINSPSKVTYRVVEIWALVEFLSSAPVITFNCSIWVVKVHQIHTIQVSVLVPYVQEK